MKAMTFDVEAARILVNRACPTDQSIGQKCFALAVDLRQACDEIEALREKTKWLEAGLRMWRDAAEAELIAARAVVEVGRVIVENSMPNNAEFEEVRAMDIHRLHVAIGAYYEAIKTEDGE